MSPRLTCGGRGGARGGWGRPARGGAGNRAPPGTGVVPRPGDLPGRVPPPRGGQIPGRRARIDRGEGGSARSGRGARWTRLREGAGARGPGEGRSASHAAGSGGAGPAPTVGSAVEAGSARPPGAGRESPGGADGACRGSSRERDVPTRRAPGASAAGMQGSRSDGKNRPVDSMNLPRCSLPREGALRGTGTTPRTHVGALEVRVRVRGAAEGASSEDQAREGGRHDLHVGDGAGVAIETRGGAGRGTGEGRSLRSPLMPRQIAAR